LGNVLTYHIPSSAPAFQAGHRSATATEAALSAIPTPEPVELSFDQFEGEGAGQYSEEGETDESTA
jgi:hypothetical protein